MEEHAFKAVVYRSGTHWICAALLRKDGNVVSRRTVNEAGEER